jgi:hypothetical protein
MHAWMVGISAGLLVVASLPYWLPTTILALRARIFTGIALLIARILDSVH